MPGGRAAAAIDSAKLPGDSVLVAGGEDGRVYLWALPRDSSGNLRLGRSSSTPHYVMHGFSEGGLHAMACTIMGAAESLVIAAGGVQHAVFLLDASNFQDTRKVTRDSSSAVTCAADACG